LLLCVRKEMRIILLHGRGQCPEVFKRLNSVLVKKSGLGALCPPGHFRLKTGGYGWYAGDRAQFDKFHRMLGDSKDNILIGFSEGGRFAMEYTLRYPGSVALLVGMCFPFPARHDQSCGSLTVPSFIVTSPSDDVDNQRQMHAVDRLFASGHRPQYLVHDKGHKVFWGCHVRNPVLEKINALK